MPVVEGYTFAVDMQDRGVKTTLRQIKADASAMKAAMRSSFETIRQGEGAFAAYDNRIKDSERLIKTYAKAQDELREKLKTIAKERQNQLEEIKKYGDSQSKAAQDARAAYDKTETSYARTARQIENFQHKINQTNASIEKDRAEILKLNTGLSRFRAETQSAKNVMTAYVNEVKSEGHAFAASRAQAQSLKVQHQALTNQYRAEVSETTRLQAKVNSLQGEYSRQVSKVAQARRAHGENSSEYRREGAALVGLKEKMAQANTEFSEQATRALRVQTSLNEVARAEESINGHGVTRLSNAMNLLDARARSATSHTREWAEGLRGGMLAAAGAAVPLGYAVGGAVKQSADLGNQWVQVKNYLYTGADSAREARSEVSKLGEMQRDAKKYSSEYGYSQKDIATQYGELVKRGYTATQSVGAMKSMLEASRASGDDFSDVIKNSTNVIDAFGIRTKASSIQAKEGTKAATEYMISQSKRVTNAMAFAADKTATNFKDMGYAMSYVSTVAKGAGFSIEQTAAAIGVLSNAGVEGSLAGTGLRKTINSLTSPTRGATAALQKYGMTMDDFKTKSGALKPLPKIMSIINEHTEKLGKADKAAFFKAVFGTTGMQAARILADQSREMGKLVDQEKEAEKHDYVGALAKKQMESTKMQLQLLKTRIQNLGIVIGNELLPQINKVGTAFNTWTQTKEGKKALHDVSEAVKDVASSMGGHSSEIFSWFGGFVEGLTSVVKPAAEFVHWLGEIVDAVEKTFGLSHHKDTIANWAGRAVGAIVGVIGTFKLFKTVVNGMSAVREDIKNLFHLGGIDEEKSKIQRENEELQANIDLWKKHNEVSGGDSAVGGSITPSAGEKGKVEGAESAGEKGAARSVEREAAQTAEKSGATSGKWYVRAFREYVVPNFKRVGNLAIMMFTGGLLDMDMISSAAKNVVSWFKAKVDKIKSWRIKPGVDERGIANDGTKAGKTFTDNVDRSVKSNGKHVSTKQMFDGSKDEAARSGKETGRSFSSNVHDSVTRNSKKVSVKDTFRDTPNEARDSGRVTGRSFTENTGKAVEEGKKAIPTKTVFEDAPKEAEVAGAKTGGSFIGRMGMAVRNSHLGGIGRFVGTKIGGAATIAFGAVDLFAALGSSSKRERAVAVGKSLGQTTGGAIGAGVGGTLGSAFGPIGTVAGSILGGAIGGTAGRTIGRTLGKAWPAIKKGATIAAKGLAKILEWPFKVAGKAARGIGKMIDKIRGGHSGSSKAGNASSAQLKQINRVRSAVRGLTNDFRKLQRVNIRRTFTQISRSSRQLYTSFRRLIRVNVARYFNNIGRSINRSRLTRNLRLLSREAQQNARTWRQLPKPLRNASTAFTRLNRSLRPFTRKNNGLTRAGNDSRSLYRTLRRYPFGRELLTQSQLANRSMNGKYNWASTFRHRVNSIKRDLRSFKSTFNRDWKETWNRLNPITRNALDKVVNTEQARFDQMRSDESKFTSAHLKAWKTWVDAVRDYMRRGFNKLPGYARTASRGIIRRLNQGITGINEVIGDFGGDKKLEKINYANGTKDIGGHPGGNMLVNDSVRPHWKELVLLPNGQAFIPQSRNTLIPNAPRGTKVMSGEQTYTFMNSLGVHQYDKGNMSDEEMDKISQLFEKNPKQASKQLILQKTHWDGAPIYPSLGKAEAIAFATGIANKLKDLLGEQKEPVNGDWRPVILSAAAKLGVHLSEVQIGKLLRQIQTESGGNEKLPQQGPSDDPDGDGSGRALGLLQFKRSTFEADAVPGHHNIWSGYDQILAAIATLNRGGEGGWGNVGNGHGWADGGFVNQHGLYEMAEGNELESIIPMDINKRPRARQMIDATLTRMEKDGGGSGLPDRYSDNSEEGRKRYDAVIERFNALVKQNSQMINLLSKLIGATNSANDPMARYKQTAKDTLLSDYQRLSF